MTQVSPLFRFINNAVEPSRVCCEVPSKLTTALVLFIIGATFIVSGLYLLLGGIGTIPAFTGGCCLFFFGIGFFVCSNALFLSNLKYPV